MTTITPGPFGRPGFGGAITLIDAESSAPVTLTAYEVMTLKEKAAFLDFLIQADPHLKEMWAAFRTKERILK